MERLSVWSGLKNVRSSNKNAELYFDNGFSSTDEDEEHVDNLRYVTSTCIKDTTKPSKVSTSSQVTHVYLNCTDSDEYSFEHSSPSSDEDIEAHHTVVNNILETKTGSGKRNMNLTIGRRGTDAFDNSNVTGNKIYVDHFSSHGINKDSAPPLYKNEKTEETRMSKSKQDVEYYSSNSEENKQCVASRYTTNKIDNRFIPKGKMFSQPCKAVFINGFEDSDDERLVTLTFSNNFCETLSPSCDSIKNDEIVSLTFDNDFSSATNESSKVRLKQNNNVDPHFDTSHSDSGSEREDDLDDTKLNAITINDTLKPSVSTINDTPNSLRSESTATHNRQDPELLVPQSVINSQCSTKTKEHKHNSSAYVTDKQMTVKVDEKGESNLMEDNAEHTHSSSYKDVVTVSKEFESRSAPVETFESTKVTATKDGETEKSENANDCMTCTIEAEIIHRSNTNDQVKSDIKAIPKDVPDEEINYKTGNDDLTVEGKGTTQQSQCLIPFRSIPFQSTFNSVGIQQKGQTIFQTHMRNSNFESLNESLLVGDDDLDIDGETSLNLDLTESLEIPTELTEKLKSHQNIGEKSIYNVPSQQPSSEKENPSSGKENPSSEKEIPSSEKEIPSSEKESSLKTRQQEATDSGAYVHTCSGCGRKDCDGNFMKLLRAMIRTGKSKGFEIRNVLPDGNCMFAAVVDQLELLGQAKTSHMVLRQSCTEYLKHHPESEDGTPFYMFLDGESWEDYLEKMSQEGKWGDHLILQAISSVTNRNIVVINGDNESNWNRIHPQIKDSVKSDPIYLGHVGELHYVSMRPVGKAGEESMCSLDLYSIEPSLPNVEDPSQVTFMEDYIDPWCNIPTIHLTFLIKQFMPMRGTIRTADSMCHTAFALESPEDENSSHRNTSERHAQVKTFGNIVDGLGSSFDCNTEDSGRGFWADVDSICFNTGMMAYLPSNESDAVDSSDVIVDRSGCHAGYVRLSAKYSTSFTATGQIRGQSRYYLPNWNRIIADETKHQKDKYASRNPFVMQLFRRNFNGVYSPFWPEEASNWITRTRTTKWPPQYLIESIVSEGVYYITIPHHTSSNPKHEFQICFGIAERRLANESLTKEQRYCFIVFRAIVDLSIKEQLIDISHLKTIFFYACEQIPEQYWASRTAACILFMLDHLIKHLESRNLPNFFIESNNMIDHLSDDQVQSLMTDLRSTRLQPIVVLYSIAYRMKIDNANEIYQSIISDIEDFQQHKSVRKSVIFTLVPTKIKQAARYIELNAFESAIEIIQEAHEDRLLVSTCEDNIPFVAFVTEVTNSFGLFKQWWLCVYADETLGTALAAELSLHHSPIPLQEVVGSEVSDRFRDLLIPKPLVEKPLTLCLSFYNYYVGKHRTKRAFAYLVKGREIFLQISKNHFVPNYPTTIDQDDFNVDIVFPIYRCLVSTYVTTTSSEPLCNLRLDQIVGEVESICEQVNTEESCAVLILMYKYLGNTAKVNQINARLDALQPPRP